MAISFPLSLNDFYLPLRADMVQWFAPPALESSEDAGGAIYRADLGARLWSGQITIAPHYHAEIRAVEAMVARLAQAGGSFLAYDKRAPFPAADPTGGIIGVSAVQIASLTAGDAGQLTLSGLPAGYVLSAGDYFSFTYAGKFALHQIVQGGAANGAGVTPQLQVFPFIRPGAVVGTAVALRYPRCKCVILPDGYKPSSGGKNLFSSGLQVQFIQTLG